MPLIRGSRPCALRWLSALMALAFAPGVLAGDVGDIVHRFDRSVAAGLPASLDLPQEGVRRAPRATREGRTLVVSRQLNVRVDFPGESTPGTMFVGTLDGEPVTLTRSGDHLDVTAVRAGGVTVLGFSEGDDTVEHEVLPDNGQQDETATDGLDTVADRSPRSLPQDNLAASLAYDLRFHVFLHDDTRPLEPRHLHAKYFAWWLSEMSGSILPTESMRLTYYQRIGWLTDMAYGHEDTLDDWDHAISLFAEAADLSYESTFHYGKTFKHKFMLFTRDQPAPGVSGQAFQGGNVATASLSGRYSIIAHEFGHTLGAMHDAALLTFEDLWVCATHMIGVKKALQANCYRYSETNARNIRAYLRHGPDWSFTKGPAIDATSNL